MKFRIISNGENNFEQEALSTISSRHHHDDGTKAVLSIVDEHGSIERKVIEEENLWRLKTQQQKTPDNARTVNEQPKAQQKQQRQQNEDATIPPPRKSEVMASCSCGKTFAAAKSEGNLLITAFDAAGNITGSYSVSGSSQQSYGASGEQKENYGVSGQTQKEYGK